MLDDKDNTESSSPNDGTAKPDSSDGTSNAGPSLAFVAGPGSAPLLKTPVPEPPPMPNPPLEPFPEPPITPWLLQPLGPTATALGTAGAVIAAAGSVVLAEETLRAAIKGEETPIEVADDYYHTHFADIWGWMKGDYPGLIRDLWHAFDNSPADSPAAPCQAAKPVPPATIVPAPVPVPTPASAPAPAPTPAPTHKPVIQGQQFSDQTCSNERLKQLHDVELQEIKDRAGASRIPFKPAKYPYDESDPKQAAKKKLLCDHLRRKEQALQDLIRKREQIRDECFDSPKTTDDEIERDDTHKTEMQSDKNALKNIQADIAYYKCP